MSKWREAYKVHPAADCFPMQSDEELAALGEDMKARGLIEPIVLWASDLYREPRETTAQLIDGRNRLEAMERAGIEARDAYGHPVGARVVGGDPVAYIIGANLRRRHLTKEEQAMMIVAMHKASIEAEEVSRQLGEKLKKLREGRPANKVKAASIASAKEAGISKRTIERAMAKVEGRVSAAAKPQSQGSIRGRIAAKQHLAESLRAAALPRRRHDLEGAREHYLIACAQHGVDLDAEQEIIMDALREIAGKRAMAS